MRTRLLPATGLVVAAALLAACSGVDDEASDPTPVTSSTPTATPTSAAPSTDAYPAFEPTDYTYRLEVICFCPLTGAVEVTVADGEVTEAVVVEGEGAGQPAPEFTRLTINDIIEAANNPSAASVDVTWPDGADHPSAVEIDRIEMATDDEVTYAISDVRVG